VAAKVAVPVIYIAESCGAPIVQLWAHVSIMPLTATQDVAVPLGAFFINMICTVLLTLASVKAMLALAPPAV
jgi:hypothetical protein